MNRLGQLNLNVFLRRVPQTQYEAVIPPVDTKRESTKSPDGCEMGIR